MTDAEETIDERTERFQREARALDQFAPRVTGVDPGLEAAARGEPIPVMPPEAMWEEFQRKLAYLESAVADLEALVHEKLQRLEEMVSLLDTRVG